MNPQADLKSTNRKCFNLPRAAVCWKT